MGEEISIRTSIPNACTTRELSDYRDLKSMSQVPIPISLRFVMNLLVPRPPKTGFTDQRDVCRTTPEKSLSRRNVIRWSIGRLLRSGFVTGKILGHKFLWLYAGLLEFHYPSVLGSLIESPV